MYNLYTFNIALFNENVLISIPFANRIGIEWAWTTFALITAVAFGGIIILMFKGEQWRKRLGQPQFHMDI